MISGFLEDVTMAVIPQTQFTPLPEVLCLVISKLNRDSSTKAASLEAILQELAHRYHGMQQPSEHLVYQALGSLCSEGNVFHTGTTQHTCGIGNFKITDNTFIQFYVTLLHSAVILILMEFL